MLVQETNLRFSAAISSINTTYGLFFETSFQQYGKCYIYSYLFTLGVGRYNKVSLWSWKLSYVNIAICISFPLDPLEMH